MLLLSLTLALAGHLDDDEEDSKPPDNGRRQDSKPNSTANLKKSMGGSKKCAGRYKGGVVSLCPEHWPDAKAEKVWFVLFYAPWCGHCRVLEPKYIAMATELREEEPGIGVGAVDCNQVPNQQLCYKQKVHGYPSLKALVMGKEKPYNGKKTHGAMKEWILKVHEHRGSKGGSSKCPTGIFKSKVRDAVVPLCDAHFPQDNAKNAWIIIFYDKDGGNSDFRDEANQAALDLGSEPPEKSKALKQVPMKRRHRISELDQKYSYHIDLPPKGPFGNEPLAKVGSICCDCSEAMRAFCDRTLGDRKDDLLPLKVWVEKGEKQVFKGDGLEARALVEFALQRLEFMDDFSRASPDMQVTEEL